MKNTEGKIISAKTRSHILTAVVSLAIVLLLARLRPEWTPSMHAWNKAFADVSFMMIAVVLFMGALARLLPPAKEIRAGWNQWQRALGIWSIVWAVVHVSIVLAAWSGEGGGMGESLIELAGFERLPGFNGKGRLVFNASGMAIANVAGLLALFYGLVLLLTSNDRGVRLLTPVCWRHLHSRFAHLLYVLAALHTAYFLYLYFHEFPRHPPPANFFRMMFPGIIGTLALVQITAFVITVRENRKSPDKRPR